MSSTLSVSKVLTPPFRADVVGSYLRPAALHAARAQFAAGDLSAASLRAIEDQEITALVARQKAAGLKVITDGEFRRSWFHLDFMWGLHGVEKTVREQGVRFKDMELRAETARITGPLSCSQHPFVAHFKFLLSFADDTVVPRLTVPAPAQVFKEFWRPDNMAFTQAVYPTQAALIEALVGSYAAFIQEIYAAGCRNLQFDDCTWGMMVDPRYAQIASKPAPSHVGCACDDADLPTIATGSVADLAETLLDLNNQVLATAPSDLVIATHVCRGNYRSHWAAAGGYAPIAPYLFKREAVAAFYLEYDTDRAGDFAPLAEVSGNKKVVLGLLSSKTGTLEDKATIIARIHEASQYIPLDRLCLSTQCGFASSEEGNDLTEAQQWAKIDLICEIAREIWGADATNASAMP